MDWLVVEGVRPWDGRYEFSLRDLLGNLQMTQREWGWIKRFSGYMPLTIDDGLGGADPELYGAFAVIALHRAGRIQPQEAQDVFDRFADVPFGSSVSLELGDAVEDGDAGPPAGSTSLSTNGSGDSSTTSSENSAETPPDTGTPDWASLASHHTRLPT